MVTPLLAFASVLEVSAATVAWKDGIAVFTSYTSLLLCFLLTNAIAFLSHWNADFVFKFDLSVSTRRNTSGNSDSAFAVGKSQSD
jgi:hypothetical protein